MTVKVRLKLNGRSVTAEGESRAQAQGIALGLYRKKHGEVAKGAKIEVISGGDKPRTPNPAPEPRPTASRGEGKGRKDEPKVKAEPKAKAKAKAEPKPKAEPKAKAEPKTEARKLASARLPEIGRVGELDRIVLGWSGRVPSHIALLPSTAQIAAARSLAETPSFGGAFRQVLVVDKTYEASPTPRSLGPGKVDLASVEGGDRVVLAFDGAGRVIEVHHVTGKNSLEEARALAGSERVGGRYRLTTTVHLTFRR